jgi:DNA repair exonuclease SbcCD ATPase subunit
VTNNAIEEARERLHTLGGEYQDAIAVHAQKAQAEGEARSRLQTLTSAVDSMRQAVSMLAAHLPEDRADCPACGVVHGPEELHKRVHASLQAIDPTLVHAERELKIAGDELRASDTAMTAARTALQSERSELAQREEQRAVLDLEIDEIRSNRHLTGDTPVLARDAVRHRLMLLDSSRQALAEEQASLAPPVAAEVSDQNSITLELALRALETVRLANAQASTHLDHATGIYAAQATESVSSKPMPELSAEQSENDQQIAALAAKAQSDNDALTRQQAELAELDSRIFDHERQLAEARSRLASIRGRWQQLALPGDPLADIARSHELRILSEISTLERHSTSLETLGLEISAWRKSEQNRVAQGLLDRRRGPQSEDEFSQQLQQRIERGRAAVSRLSNLSSALESLSRFLSAEISNIHDHVVAVVPRWQALLKRIVRDQRFSQTNLDFYSHYKKEHAAVLVPLHGDTVPVPSVASEAQMTDLQLTFLLSMAMNHRWSPWRALLLDDPTQHHDLVHAASVFDVLRDYIVDHDFQIVIATHDALQARFFMRKLQNDGIDARMWSLVPTVQGVTAIPGK